MVGWFKKTNRWGCDIMETQEKVLNFLKFKSIEGISESSIYDHLSQELDIDVQEIRLIISSLLKKGIIKKICFINYSPITKSSYSGFKIMITQKTFSKPPVFKKYDQRIDKMPDKREHFRAREMMVKREYKLDWKKEL